MGRLHYREREPNEPAAEYPQRLAKMVRFHQRDHRAAAAARAISERCLGVNALVRCGPPFNSLLKRSCHSEKRGICFSQLFDLVEQQIPRAARDDTEWEAAREFQRTVKPPSLDAFDRADGSCS
jgi:hypothetical protein